MVLRETGGVYDTIGEAVDAAKMSGPPVITLDIGADLTESGTTAVESLDVTIAGTGRVTGFASTVGAGGHLKLGGYGDLVLAGNVEVTDGSFSIESGATLTNPAPAISSSCVAASYPALRMTGSNVTGRIAGGRIVGCTALLMRDGATLSEMSGGELVGLASPLDASGSTIGVISGGAFVKDGNTVDRYAVTLENSRVGRISGGDFNATGSPHGALLLLDNSWVDEISGGRFFTPSRGKAAVRMHAMGDPTGIGTVSGGDFTGGAAGMGTSYGYALWLSGTNSRVETITGGVFEAERALMVEADCAVDRVSGGRFVGATQNDRPGYGVMNAGTIQEIGGDAEIAGRNAGIWNYAGQIDEISGGTISSSGAYVSGNGISNSGSIGLISGGTVIGDLRAITSVSGSLSVISGGVFWGKTDETFRLGSSVQLEPGLTGSRGVGRYQSGNQLIFNDESLVVYPPGYAMSSEADTLPVPGVDEVTFRYLRLPPEPEFAVVVEGSCAAADGTGTYPSGTEVTLDAGDCAGKLFVEWVMSVVPDDADKPFGADLGSPVTTFFMPEADVTVTAVWVLCEADGCEEAPGTGSDEEPPGEGAPAGGPADVVGLASTGTPLYVPLAVAMTLLGLGLALRRTRSVHPR